MCMRSLASRGVRSIRPSSREDRMNSPASQRDEDEIAKKKVILRKRAQHPAKEAKRARRHAAKMETEGERIFRRLGFM